LIEEFKLENMDYCCPALKLYVTLSCPQHPLEDCPDLWLRHNQAYGEYQINIMKHATYSINYCPFCGSKFPESFRDKWFEELESKGIDPWEDEIPGKYKSAAWRS